MDSKYNVEKPRKPQNRQEQIAADIEALVKLRDAAADPKERQALNAQITKLFAQYERTKL